MRPVLFELQLWGNQITIFSYATFNVVLFGLVFLASGYFFLRRGGLKPGPALLILTGLVAVVIIGSRLWYVLMNPGLYLNGTARPFDLAPGSFFMFGGFLLAIPCVFLMCRAWRIDPRRVLDAITPGWALGISFNKTGCFLNGCCFGTPTPLPWGMVPAEGSRADLFYDTVHINQYGDTFRFYVSDLTIHPVQLYESIFGVAGFLLALYLLKRKISPGVAFMAFLAAYSLARYVFHFLRAVPVSEYNELVPLLYAASALAALVGLYLVCKTSPRTGG